MGYGMFDVKSKIHISAGLPCTSVLPFPDIIKIISNDLNKENDPEILQYGFSRGYLRFREILARFINDREQRIIDPNSLFITNGATHGILLSIIALSKGKASIIVERPTYFPLLDLFKELNLDVYFADVDECGISTDSIRKQLKSITSGTTFIHCTPYFQNPTGVCINKDKANELMDIVNSNPNTWLLSDNVYKYLNFSIEKDLNLFTLDQCERFIQISSFSKIFGPGLRVGWLEATESIIKTIEESGYVQSSGGFNPFVCRSIEHILETGMIHKIIDGWITFLKTKQKSLVADLRTIFPEAEFIVPRGGYYIWVNLKNDLIGNSKFREFVKNKKDLVYVPGTKCAGNMDLYKSYTRLGFATYKEDELAVGLRKLKESFEEFNHVSL